MTRLKFDVTGVDPGGDFAVPKPGAYACKIESIEPKESQAGNEMLEVVYVITEDGEFENSKLWDYIVLTENQRWKYRRFLEAVGAVTSKKESGEIDIDKLIGNRVLVKVTNEDSEEWGKRARVGSVSKLKNADIDAGDDDEGEDDDGDEDEGYSYDEIMAMSKTELKDLIDEEELEVRVTKATKVANLRPKVAEALELEEEPEDEPEDEDEDGEGDDEEELTAEDIQGYNKTELKEVIEENELGIRVTKQTKLANLRKKVIEKMVEEEMIEDPDAEEEGDGDDEVEEIEDYAELSVSELRAECKERGLNTKGSKTALVKRLEKDDEEADAL